MPRLIAFAAAALFVLSCSKDPLSTAAPTSPSATSAVQLDCRDTFNIELVYLPGERPLGALEKGLIESAAHRWEAIITGGLSDVSFRGSPVNDYSPLLETYVQIDDVIDDLRIYIRVKDLPGTTGGSAWPTWTRRSNNLPIVAELAIDPAELEEDLVMGGGFGKIVLHEIGHCLGFGTIWDDLNLIKSPSASGGRNPYFDGASTWGFYLELLGWPDDYENFRVPIEAGGDDAHWRSSIFGDELMARQWAYPYDKKLSTVTLGSMSDLGYEVNYWAADESFVLPIRSAAKIADQAAPRCVIERRPIRRR